MHGQIFHCFYGTFEEHFKRTAEGHWSNSSNTKWRTLPGFQSPSAFWKGEQKASLLILMHEGIVIPVKSDVEYSNWLLKPASTLKYFKITSTLKYFKGTSTLKLFWIIPAFPCGRIWNPPPTLKTVLPPVSKDWLNIWEHFFQACEKEIVFNTKNVG